MSVVAALIVFAAAAAATPPIPETAGQLLEFCRGTVVQEAYCVGFVHGFGGGSASTSATFGVAQVFCFPEGATIKQSLQVVLKWTEMHPEQWHQRPEYAVGAALYEAFPCPAKQP